MPIPTWIVNINDDAIRARALVAQVNFDRVKITALAERNNTVNEADRVHDEKIQDARDSLEAIRLEIKRTPKTPATPARKRGR